MYTAGTNYQELCCSIAATPESLEFFFKAFFASNGEILAGKDAYYVIEMFLQVFYKFSSMFTFVYFFTL